jgi:Concanavalin A-like lectin/glucanases superfamily
MSFEDRQKTYYTKELNRVLPTRGGPQDLATLDAALVNTDPVMPTTGISQRSDVQSLLSTFGSASNVLKRDSECHAIPYPGSSMRVADARTGCGWWHVDNPSIPSSGAYGTRRGPMSPDLDTQVGPGRWVWDTEEAYKLESQKQAAKIKSCQDLQFSPISAIGWCPSTNRAVVTDGNGFPAYPLSVGGDCPGGGIIMNSGSCPPPPSSTSGGAAAGMSASTTALCKPGPGGVRSPACLQAITQMVCSPAGTLSQALSNGYAGTSYSVNATNSYLQQRGFTLNPGIMNDGKVDTGTALASVTGLRRLANSGDGSKATLAAQNLCTGTPFDPCAFGPNDPGPFPAACITQAALAKGYSPSGGLLPAQIGMAYWSVPYYSSWSKVLGNLDAWKNIADNGNGPQPYQTQSAGIKYVYGVGVKFPKKGCNVSGIFMYRYICPVGTLQYFPPSGPQTHFLGRYLLKDGFPQQSQQTSADLTPAGGFLAEGQRMITVFTPTQGGNYQFLISCDDFVRLQLNGKVIAEVPCCNIPTPSQIVPLIAGQQYPLIVDMVNLGGLWSFSIQMSIGGSPWAPIPAAQLTMPQDRRLPTVELAFNKMVSGSTGPFKDTNNVYANLLMNSAAGAASIGSLNGKQCMIVTGPGAAVYNYQKNAQGVRGRAFKAITMMVCVTGRTAGSSSVSPALFNFFNTANSIIGGAPRLGRPPEPVDYAARIQDLSLYLLNGQIQLVHRDDSRGILSQYYGNVQPITYNTWTHIAIVWDDDWNGYAMYINGALVGQLQAPGPDVKLIFEQIRIGSADSQDGAGWTGGIAWFRGFDHRLGVDDIKMDMGDDWSSL